MTPITPDQQEARKGPQSGTPGALLRQAREASGKTHAVVAEALHLTVHYVKSLENDDYSKLPGLIFVKGYLRSYARFLKIDVDNLMACYDAHVGALPEIKNQTLGGNYTRKRNDQAIGWAVAAALVVLMGLGAGWWFFGRSEPVAAADGATTSTAAEQANRSASAMREITTATGTTALGVPIAPAGAAGPNAYNGATYATAPQASALEGTTTGTSVNAIEGAIVPALPTADVVSGAATILPAAVGQDSVIVAVSPAAPLVPADATVATTVSDTTAATAAASGSSTTTTLAPSGGRQINLLGAGADQLQLTFTGDSWVEIDDGRNARLYNEMLRGGDTLLVQGQAPFQVLFGDGRNVAVTFNSSPIDISSSIRNDSTSRITLSNTATMSVQTDESSAGIQSTATEPAAATATSNGNATSNNGVVQ